MLRQGSRNTRMAQGQMTMPMMTMIKLMVHLGPNDVDNSDAYADNDCDKNNITMMRSQVMLMVVMAMAVTVIGWYWLCKLLCS